MGVVGVSVAAERFGRVVPLAIGVAVVAALGGAAAVLLGWRSGLLLVVLAALVAGVTLVACPFATPSALRDLGMRRTRDAGRVVGALVTLVGVIVLLRALR